MTGLGAERAVAAVLRELNYAVASRRHEAGPGDILAVPLAVREQRPLLVEVKATTGLPWASSSHFGPVDRGALLLAGDCWDCEPMLAWLPPWLQKRGEPARVIWLPDDEWPRQSIREWLPSGKVPTV